MSIYSSNRTGSMLTSSVACNENYTDSDFGRIMYESAMNDMAIFEALIIGDLREAKCLREGTLLEAEVNEANKKTIKDLIDKLKQMLANVWAKIKAAIEAAIRKIAAYVLKDGKAFAKDFRIATKDKAYTGSKVVTLYDMNKIALPTPNGIEDAIRANLLSSDSVDNKAVTNEILSDLAGENVTDTKNYKAAVIKAAEKKETINSKSQIEMLLKTIENAPEEISRLKSFEKNAEQITNKVANKLKEAERELGKDGDKKEQSNMVKKITTLVSVWQKILSCVTATAIGIEKTNVKNARVALGEIKRELLGGNDAVNHESAAIADADEVETALDDSPKEEETPEVKEEIQEVIDKVDAETAPTVE